MQFILQKRRVRILSAILIAALALTMSMVLPAATGQQDSEVHAADTVTLTVTLTGAKVTAHQTYDTMGVPNSTLQYDYDSATLYVYDSNTERWNYIASDTLDGRWTPGTIAPAYAKSAFTFKFDSRYAGRTATIVYTNAAQTATDYGTKPSQVLGGYFGLDYIVEDAEEVEDIKWRSPWQDAYVEDKTSIQTFPLGAGAATFALADAVYQTATVAPVSGPYDANGEFNEAGAYQDTRVQAYLVANDNAGTVNLRRISPLSITQTRYNAMGYEVVVARHFSNPTTGTYVFPTLPGQKVVFQASGEYADNAQALATPYQAQWLGGYESPEGIYDINTIVGDPKNVTQVKIGSVPQALKAITLKKGTAKITGTAPAGSVNDIAAEGVVGNQLRVLESKTSVKTPATYEEYRDQYFTSIPVEMSYTGGTPANSHIASSEDEYALWRQSMHAPSYIPATFNPNEVYIGQEEGVPQEITTDAYDAAKRKFQYTWTSEDGTTNTSTDSMFYELYSFEDVEDDEDSTVTKCYHQSYNFYKYSYTFYKDAATYTIDGLVTGVYYVSFGGKVQVVAVKNGQTKTINFTDGKDVPNFPGIRTDITGERVAGQKLTVASRVPSPRYGQGVPTYKYFWTDGVKILSKKAAYKLTSKNVNKNFWALSVNTVKTYQATNGWVAAPGNAYNAFTFKVKVTGTFKKGKKVKVKATNADVKGVKYTYQWLRNGKAIKKATKATYKLTAKDKGKKISVQVTGKKANYATKVVKSKAKKAK
jgi:hypothetical protein